MKRLLSIDCFLLAAFLAALSAASAADPGPAPPISPGAAESDAKTSLPSAANARAASDLPTMLSLVELKLRSIVVQDAGPWLDLPLSEVIKVLHEQSRRLDPERVGIDFRIKSDSPSLALDAATGRLRTAGGAADALHPGAVGIKLDPPMVHVHLSDLLDCIVKGADAPIKYTISESGVVFSLDPDGKAPRPKSSQARPGARLARTPARPDPSAVQPEDPAARADRLARELATVIQERDGALAELAAYRALGLSPGEIVGLRRELNQLKLARKLAEPLMTRHFILMTNDLAPRLEKDFGIRSDPRMASSTHRLESGLRQWLEQLGVHLAGEESLSYEEASGRLTARATAGDLAAITAAVQKLGGHEENSRPAQ